MANLWSFWRFDIPINEDRLLRSRRRLLGKTCKFRLNLFSAKSYLVSFERIWKAYLGSDVNWFSPKKILKDGSVRKGEFSSCRSLTRSDLAFAWAIATDPPADCCPTTPYCIVKDIHVQISNATHVSTDRFSSSLIAATTWKKAPEQNFLSSSWA